MIFSGFIQYSVIGFKFYKFFTLSVLQFGFCLQLLKGKFDLDVYTFIPIFSKKLNKELFFHSIGKKQLIQKYYFIL